MVPRPKKVEGYLLTERSTFLLCPNNRASQDQPKKNYAQETEHIFFKKGGIYLYCKPVPLFGYSEVYEPKKTSYRQGEIVLTIWIAVALRFPCRLDLA